MKTFKQLSNDHLTLKNRIAANEAKIEALTLMPERRAAAGNIEEHEKIYAQYENNLEEIAQLSEAVYLDKITIKYIVDNYKVALFEACKPAIIEILTRYNGKPYGEKTSDKIKKELEEKTGCYIYIHGYEVCIRRKDDYYNEVRATTSYKNPIITNENRISAGALAELHTHEQYTENPTKAARALIKAYNKAYKALEETNKLLNEFNHIAPAGIDHKYISTHLYRTIL